MTDPRSRMATWAAAILAAGVVLYVLKDVLLPFVAGFLVAYMADPLVRRLTRIGLGRAVASMIAILVWGACRWSQYAVHRPL